MASPQEIQRAIDILRGPQGTYGKSGKRQHPESLDDIDAVRNALEHPCCGQCTHLTVQTFWKNGHEQVWLDCAIHHSPRDMWYGWAPPDVPVTCLDCTDPAGRKSTS